MRRVLLFDNGNVEIFSSPENLCAYVEYPSFNGDEEAILETGELVKLFLDHGTIIKGIFRKKFASDFIFVNFELTNDFSMEDLFKDKIIKFLYENKIKHSDDSTLSELFEITQNFIGITY